MDPKKHRNIVRENSIHKSLTAEKIYDKHNIKQELSEEDIMISLLEKKVYLYNDTTHIFFMTYILLEWYRNSELQRFPNPFGVDGTDIILSDGWEIVNKEKILLPSEIRRNEMIKKQKDKIK